MAAEPFPEPWGLEYITGNNTNIFKASIEALKQSGSDQIVSSVAFGMLPLTLFAVVYLRTQSVGPALMISMLALLGLYLFGLVSPGFSVIIGSVQVLAAAAFWGYSFFKKR